MFDSLVVGVDQFKVMLHLAIYKFFFLLLSSLEMLKTA